MKEEKLTNMKNQKPENKISNLNEINYKSNGRLKSTALEKLLSLRQEEEIQDSRGHTCLEIEGKQS